MAAIVRKVRGEKFEVETGTLAFSVTVYCIFAVAAIILLVVRRHKLVGKFWGYVNQ